MDVKLEDLLISYLQCRSNKRNTRAALQFEQEWESNLMELYRELCEDRYRPSPSFCFIVENPVKREVFAAAFRDRIVHHYVVSRLEPFLEPYFITDSYSCRKGKGTLFGVNGFPTPADLQRGTQLDLFGCNKQQGLPIGNLTSQWFANFYMTPFDHYCKHTVGLRYYGRYVDDFFVVHPDRAYLKALIPQFRAFLTEQLHVRLHPNKTRLTDYRKGVSFIGVTIRGRVMLSGKRIRRNSSKALQQWNELAASRKLADEEVERCTQVINSYLGMMRHHHSYRYRLSIVGGMSPQLRNYFCTNSADKIISWDRIGYKAWLSVRRECYARLRVLKEKYPDQKYRFDELYADICMERYLKKRGGIAQ